MIAPKARGWKEKLQELGLSRSRRKARVASRPGTTTRDVGLAGEDAAARYLGERGMKIVARNVRYPDGELDLVGWEAGVIVFVEVKWRRSSEPDRALEVVTARKRSRVVRAARRWLAENGTFQPRDVRFDVVAIQGAASRVDWIRGAFDASDH